jgi:PhoH-like ATPase
MKKIYVLDTNVLLADFMSYRQFEDNIVIIPSTVLEEVDSKKKYMDSVGFNARAVGRELDELRKLGNLAEGVDLDNGGHLRVYLKNVTDTVLEHWTDPINDNYIVATALAVQKENPDIPVILVSKDALVRVKADAVGLKAEDYMSDKVISVNEDTYKGYTVLDVDAKFISSFNRSKRKQLETPLNAPTNHYVVLRNGSQKVVGRYRDGYVEHLYHYTDEFVFGLKARNPEQQIALDLLLDESIPLVTIVGKAGTGKTLLALAAGLEQTLERRTYEKILVARPVIPMGRDIGYLPGEMEEKLRPWIQPIYDNLEFIFNCKERKESIDKLLQGLQRELQVEALTYIRGRSIPDQFIIIDEAQNLTKHEVKTILTRVGEGSKIVLMGDPEQIDHPYLDQYNNGLVYVVEKMKEYDITGHIALEKGERSTLAQMCADLL